MRIIINGSEGRMGKVLGGLAEERNFTVSARVDKNGGEYSCLEDFGGEADIIIDFSHHSAVSDILKYAAARKLPVVIATTGHTAEELLEIGRAAETLPVFLSGNMSLGVALLAKLAAEAARVFPNADIEIVESHHNKKLDVPSGTALLIANALKAEREDAVFNIGRSENGLRPKGEIGIHSLRYGSEVGDHKVIISTESEVISLEHKAQNRGLFAEGALGAAEFLIKQAPGLYSMKEYIDSGK